MDEDEIREVRERYERAKLLLTDTVRRRMLTYGTESSTLLLLCFDDLGRVLDSGSSDHPG